MPSHIFADIEKRTETVKDSLLIQIYESSTGPEHLKKRTETVIEIIILCPCKFLDLPPSLDKHYINVVVVAVSTFVKLLN